MVLERVLLCCVLIVGPGLAGAYGATRPHIVLIMADDLGYGDVEPLNPDLKLSTPAFNRLAQEGITFTDAHTPSSVCTPTRYGLLTGRYSWRTRLKRGVLNGYGAPLIEADRGTIASVLKRSGYRTAIVGKWHLGLGLRANVESGLDLSVPLTHHPGTVGFDQSFIIPASLDFPPYVYFRNGIATSRKTVEQQAVGFPGYTRRGPRADDFDMRGCLDRLAEEAIRVVKAIPSNDKPQFLYFPLTAPHKPVLPNREFAGTTATGPYTDFVRQVDATIGRVLTALDEAGVMEETVVIVTSDNGSFMKRIPAGSADHVSDQTVQGYHADHHRANGPWRGTKADIWEAGHRVPFFVRLPGKKLAGTRESSMVGLIDIFATLAELTATPVSKVEGPDSVSFMLLFNERDFERSPLIMHSAAGMFAIRKGSWKLIAGNGSGGREQPKGRPFAEPWMLVDLETDPIESQDKSKSNPEMFNLLKNELLRIKGDD